MLEEFLHTWESIDDGCIKAVVYGEKITIDQFGMSDEWVVNATNTLVKEAQVVFKNIVGPNAFVNKE